MSVCLYVRVCVALIVHVPLSQAAAQSLSSRASELNPVSVNQLGLTSRYLVNQDLYVPALLDLNKELTIQQIESVSPNVSDMTL